jgi:hypothetical protein
MTAPTMNEIITRMSNYVRDSGFTIEWDDSACWVDIASEDFGTAFFLENDEAEQFIAEATKNAEEADVHEIVAMLARAKSYIDCI